METILLVGPKHSGKTSAGRALARLWTEKNDSAASFIDLDELVEDRTGKSPRSLYGEGPEIFRKAEAEALRDIFDQAGGVNRPGLSCGPDGKGGRRIVAAGGGLADNGEAMDLLKRSVSRSSGRVFTVYIEVAPETAWERIAAAAENGGGLPPFLKTENPRETHRRLHQRRGAAYREIADLSVRAGETPEETAALILKSLEV
ncbi:MAG: shikimate kinase [Treponema sp.]|jgi:shikimate kinase|nr:shikimate kinase [Treponema sp.]